MDKRNGKRHNFFTEMATSSIGGCSPLCQIKLIVLQGPNIPTGVAVPFWVERDEQLAETEPDTSGWVSASTGLQLHENV